MSFIDRVFRKTKMCVTCGLEKSTQDFYTDKSKKDGLTSDCRECKKKRSSQWHESNSERARASHQAYYESRADEFREKSRAYYEANKDQLLPKMYVYAREHREQNNVYKSDWNKRNPEYKKGWAQDNSEKMEEYRRKNYEENKERYLEQSKKWQHEHPESKAATMRKRRAQKVGGGGTHTTAQWLALCEHYGNICLCCKQSLPLERDHVIPLKKKGTDDISNIQPLCRSCNSRKGIKTTDFRA